MENTLKEQHKSQTSDKVAIIGMRDRKRTILNITLLKINPAHKMNNNRVYTIHKVRGRKVNKKSKKWYFSLIKGTINKLTSLTGAVVEDHIHAPHLLISISKRIIIGKYPKGLLEGREEWDLKIKANKSLSSIQLHRMGNNAHSVKRRLMYPFLNANPVQIISYAPSVFGMEIILLTNISGK